ncbi:WD40 repeat-like protein [Coccomyxa subellipsoidea C-169]|uniref:WD40 repeat-like protein n=1 Tax=Coccomyxa subellipsoidea (strain C-169) TaxID=574566 RepID=I0YIR8_COCSC|nr:WD40 repeat-like protein [Coccomyxa subellipsoidea C-169]EIE18287.1 WD40 repeat-like protein [Coccomyxa subellipsoidea C-169]|eukprot:XP_005642831.1 WD40 repeat-like protein [Coccomyxa subellipsoidea C-169]
MTIRTLAIASGSIIHVWQPSSNGNGSNKKPNETVNFSLPDRCNGVAWNANGKAIAASGSTGHVSVYRPTGESIGSLPSPGDETSLMGEVSCLSFSRGSKLLAAGCLDGLVHVWSLNQQERVLRLIDHVDAVTSISFSPDGRTLASSSVSGQLLLHNTEGIKKARLQSRNLAPITCITYAPLSFEKQLLACSTRTGAVEVHALNELRPGEEHPNLHKGPAAAVRFVDGMGNLLISAGADGSLVLIDRRLGGMAACARTGRSLSTLDMHHDGHSIAVGTTGGGVLLYDARKLGVKPFNRLDLPLQERVNEVRWQPAAPTELTDAYQQPVRVKGGQPQAPTQAQAFAREKGASTPFTPLDNQTLAPGLLSPETLATPYFDPKAVPRGMVQPQLHPHRLSKEAHQAESLANLQDNAASGGQTVGSASEEHPSTSAPQMPHAPSSLPPPDPLTPDLAAEVFL